MAEGQWQPGSAGGALVGGFDRIRLRVWLNRWPLIGFTAVLVVLAASGLASWTGMFLVLAAAFAVLALAPGSAASAVSGQAQWEAAAVPNEPGIANVVMALPNPSYVLDRQGIVRVLNAPATTLFPIRLGEPLTVRLRVPDVIAAFDRVAIGGSPERVQFSERVPTERWFAGWFAGIGERDGRGQPGLIVFIVDDLTEQRRADRIRVDFVANASHELRTPLASLAGFIETLQGPARADPEARERFLGIMHDQATRMSRLIDDLLSLSRIEMKQHLRPSEPVELVDLVRHVADALGPLAREKSVTIETELPDAKVVVPGDHDELVQVFDNLVENACHYGRSGGRVVVKVTAPAEPGGACSVSVRDFGPGIATEHLPRLTERFYRVDAEVSRQHRGTGLGLAIVKHIANRHRARLAIDSAPGKGALFTVEFPATMTAKKPVQA